MRNASAIIRVMLLSLSALFAFRPFQPGSAHADVYPLYPRENVIGEIRHTTAHDHETLIDIARRFDVGYDEIIKANLGLNRWVPESGARVVIPSRFILPDAPHEGIVVNLAELRLYYFPTLYGSDADRPLSRPVATFPVSVGRMDWRTPLGKTRVSSKERNPAWRPPKSIKEEHAREGEILPDVIPGGHPENPLGEYALRLAIPGYLIHGVDARKAFGIGMRVTHGCIRMYPEDIERLYSMVAVGTPVYLVDQPVKVGWRGGTLYLEVHNPLEDDSQLTEAEYEQRIANTFALIRDEAKEGLEVDEEAVVRAVRLGDGVPTPVGSTRTGLPPARDRDRTR